MSTSSSFPKLEPRLPEAAGVLARAAAAKAKAAGLDLQPLLRQSGVTQEQIDDRRQRINAGAQIIFVEKIARALGAVQLGLELATSVDLREMGLLYYVGASADTLGESIRRIARYSTLGNEAVRIHCAGCLTVTLHYDGTARHLDRQQMEYFLVVVVRLFRQLSGTDVTPTRVRLAHEASPVREAYTAAFGRMPEFGAGEDALQFQDSVGRMPVTSADPYLAAILTRYCEEMLAQRPDAPRQPIRTAVENALAPLLPHGRPELETVAAVLKVSARTLARRLAEEGVTLSLILDEMRRDLSIRYLKDSSLSVAQVAWLVGYSDAAAFSNAFRRWTGRSPRKLTEP